MMRLEEITRGALLAGLLPSGPVTVIDVRWHGSNVVELFYKDASGRPGTELVFRDREPMLEIVTPGRPWNLDADGAALRLVSEALRICLAHLFDPLLAVHTSLIEPLPHQITAVYGEMLRRQPLRFLLADDPGAGKTIMAGLLIKELMLRGDVHRCLIVCPGSLVEQWQDELSAKFDLPFEILTNDRIEAARTGNALAEMPLVIARLDKLARDEVLQSKLARTEWDLVVVDEAHKMSASFFSGEIRETKRYKLGKLLASVTRHLLLMTATPHNGKEEDFQLFMALLDGDRFEGRFRDGVHTTDVSDLMRRMVKEDLVRFDGTPLFPERKAYTVAYELSDGEAALYKAVTDYVRQEFNRADALQNEGRKGTVGFALTILQRRLASSPEAIYQSLRRRRERLERRLREEEALRRGAEAQRRLAQLAPAVAGAAAGRGPRLEWWDELPQLDASEWADLEDDAPAGELEQVEEAIVDQATAAQTIAELRAEIETLKELEALALRVRQSGTDRKWEELSKILQDREVMFDARGHRRKLVIFTEHRDTARYLAWRIQTLLGRPEAVVVIEGTMGREERRKAQELFTQDPNVHVLVATDAAGEGINLQRAHLMVNYDLPWNPNRLEQRFGRIHRIGQTEVCHLWNLVAQNTREGEVYLALLRKLEAEQRALGGRVFDVLGKAIDGAELRNLMIEAIRYGDRPDVRARLNQVVAVRLDRERLRQLLEEGALARDTLDARQVQQIREEMERAEARRLQPHFIEAFFLEAFRQLGGAARQREPRRYEITHVPSVIRQRDRVIGRGAPVLPRYERICFEKELIRVPGRPPAAFVCPGHPLLDATIDVILERYRPLLKQGAVLVDERDEGETPRWLFYLEHAIRDGRVDGEGRVRVVSRRLQFVEIDADGRARNAGYAPYLDYRPVAEEEKALLAPELEARLQGAQAHDLEAQAVSYAIEKLVPAHFEEVRRHKVALVEKTMAAVKDRLTKEIAYWDHRAEELRLQEQAGKVNARINSARARQRADELQARLEKRMRELEQEKNLAALPPEVLGYALIVPVGLLRRLRGEVAADEPGLFARETEEVERLAMEAVLAIERALGYEPRDVSRDRCGYDIESRIPTQPGRLRFIEVKGRVAGARTVTVTKNEILTALNKPEDYILALVQVKDGRVQEVRYVRRPFRREPDFGAASVNYDWEDLWGRGETPRQDMIAAGEVD
ncbi:DNA/RNA helicase, superfamily II, SNF2 family [Thermaerobacter subterraneus DSM 13965]|uniref:DNA/RNA helicase, superfamily II, SNF2 family n=2 Tax=Thermaerobacter TaxID=73918 RepID=K6QEW2_9FIRM|nr:DNA/RNA helicase, superfamily II, SNF2 family [Thermaerobacter subterraneus DSM 13965]